MKKRIKDNGNGLTHVDADGRVTMVDVSEKLRTRRAAVASCAVVFEKDAFERIMSEGVAKGDILCVAKTAAIMAAKKTSELIPMCHQINLAHCDIHFDIDRRGSRIRIFSRAVTAEATGVEMEAIIAAQIAAATVYDMCKAVSKRMVISDCTLVHKSGGKSGTFNNANAAKDLPAKVAEWIEKE